MTKSKVIELFCAEYSRTNFENPFKEKLLPYTALAESLNLKMWHSADGFEFRLPGRATGRLIAKVAR